MIRTMGFWDRFALFVLAIAFAAPFAFGQDFPESSRRLCFGEYAFCSASTCKPNGKMIRVNTENGYADFPAADCTCPVLHGLDEVEVAGGNMTGSCKAPTEDTVWSGFWVHAETPQELSNWQKAPAPGLLCGRDLMQGNQQVNCYSFLCKKKGIINGQEVAECECPMGESFNGTPIPANTAFFTQAGQCNTGVCSDHPVSDPIGFDDIKKGGQCVRFPEQDNDSPLNVLWGQAASVLSWDGNSRGLTSTASVSSTMNK